VIEPSIARKNGLIMLSSGVGSSKNSSAIVFARCDRSDEAFLSTV
jgi:hypothetical protein